MWPSFTGYNPNLKLQSDDIRGIQSLYGQQTANLLRCIHIPQLIFILFMSRSSSGGSGSGGWHRFSFVLMDVNKDSERLCCNFFRYYQYSSEIGNSETLAPRACRLLHIPGTSEIRTPLQWVEACIKSFTEAHVILTAYMELKIG